MPFEHAAERLVVDEGRSAHRDSPWAWPTISNDEVPELTIGRLHGGVDLANRSVEAAIGHDQLKVLDGRLNRAIHIAFLRKHRFAFRIGVDRTAGDAVNQLVDDAGRLFDFFKTNEIATQAVAILGNRDIK